MGEVISLGNVTRLDIPVDRVLESAKGQLAQVVLLGYDHNGGEYFASSVADGSGVLWLLERCKQVLFDNISDQGV